MKKGKVLVADDEPNILTVVQFLVERAGYEVETASNGETVKIRLPLFQPDVLILDVMMPGLNGFDLARWIRDQEEYQNLRIIFLTAKGTSADRFEGYDSGGEVYLTKPFDNQELLDTLDEVIEFG
jgi:DNA-binding response OmpR family regulator